MHVIDRQNTMFKSKKVNLKWAGDPAEVSQVCTALAVDLSLVPSTHTRRFPPSVTPAPGDLTPSSGLHLLHSCAHQTQASTSDLQYIFKTQVNSGERSSWCTQDGAVS